MEGQSNKEQAKQAWQVEYTMTDGHHHTEGLEAPGK